MLSPTMFLRQKYSLSFFATTLLIALTTESSLAFSITSPYVWDTEESYTLANQSTVTTRLSPINIASLPRGGTSSLLALLNLNFLTWTFTPASNDLVGTFEIQAYDAVATSDNVGAQLLLNYIPGISVTDPTPELNNLHWIQRVYDNHNVTNNPGHGNIENVIDIGSGVTNPFYDTAFLANETTFFDFSRRPDVNSSHNWLAELYLVEEIAPRQVTIYNGIQWGWENTVESVPEPLTILASGVSLGFGVLFKKNVQGNRKKQKAFKN